MSDRVVVTCAHCGAALRVPSGKRGEVRCPKCSEGFYADTLEQAGTMDCTEAVSNDLMHEPVQTETAYEIQERHKKEEKVIAIAMAVGSIVSVVFLLFGLYRPFHNIEALTHAARQISIWVVVIAIAPGAITGLMVAKIINYRRLRRKNGWRLSAPRSVRARSSAAHYVIFVIFIVAVVPVGRGFLDYLLPEKAIVMSGMKGGFAGAIWGETRIDIKRRMGNDESIPILQDDRLAYKRIIGGMEFDATYWFDRDCILCLATLVEGSITYTQKKDDSPSRFDKACGTLWGSIMAEYGEPMYESDGYFVWKKRGTEASLLCKYMVLAQYKPI